MPPSPNESASPTTTTTTVMTTQPPTPPSRPLLTPSPPFPTRPATPSLPSLPALSYYPYSCVVPTGFGFVTGLFAGGMIGSRPATVSVAPSAGVSRSVRVRPCPACCRKRANAARTTSSGSTSIERWATR